MTSPWRSSFSDRLGEPRDRLDSGDWRCACSPGSGNAAAGPTIVRRLSACWTCINSAPSCAPHQTTTAPPAKKDKDVGLNVAGKKPKDGSDPIDEFGGKLVAEKEAASDLKDVPAADKKTPAVAKKSPLRPDMLAPHLRKLPVVRNQGKGKGNHHLNFGPGRREATTRTRTIRASLASGPRARHAVPSEFAALLTAYQRFVVCQSLDFGWGYHALGIPHDTTNTMTCVGLLGMAMGHGVAPEIVKADPNDPKIAVSPDPHCR